MIEIGCNGKEALVRESIDDSFDVRDESPPFLNDDDCWSFSGDVALRLVAVRSELDALTHLLLPRRAL